MAFVAGFGAPPAPLLVCGGVIKAHEDCVKDMTLFRGSSSGGAKLFTGSYDGSWKVTY